LIRSTGLDLSVVKESIDFMKGEIMVFNTLGNGIRFIVKLPKTEAF
jgi:signal transduction histidine kinase